MTKNYWKKKIMESCGTVGTYRPAFEPVIDTLAETLQRRDEVAAEYKKLGSQPVLQHTNNGGSTNITKNPLLTQWDDLNKSALAYWRDLGLTPAGLKKIDENAMRPQKRDPLAAALEGLES